LIYALKKIYHRQSFFPNWIGVFVNPFYFARRGLADAIEKHAHFANGRLLDVGCGTKPYEKKFLYYVTEYIGLDVDSALSRQRNIAEHLYDGKKFPFKNNSFETILCNQVLEHIFNPDEFLSEIHRVLTENGKLLLTVPFVWDEHEQPFDYARYSSFGLRALLERNQFTVLTHQKIGADASILFQLINAYLFKVTQNWSKIPKFFMTITVMASINLLGLAAKSLLPANPDLFLDHIIVAEKRQ
jgi:SAM-dependent methyltransferase